MQRVDEIQIHLRPMRLRCACGWEQTGLEAKIMAAAEEHGRRDHDTQLTRAAVLAMVVTDTDPSAPDG